MTWESLTLNNCAVHTVSKLVKELVPEELKQKLSERAENIATCFRTVDISLLLAVMKNRNNGLRSNMMYKDYCFLVHHDCV